MHAICWAAFLHNSTRPCTETSELPLSTRAETCDTLGLSAVATLHLEPPAGVASFQSIDR